MSKVSVLTTGGCHWLFTLLPLVETAAHWHRVTTLMDDQDLTGEMS